MEVETLSKSIIADGRMNGAFTGWGTQRVVTLFVGKSKDVQVIADTDGYSITDNKKIHHDIEEQGHKLSIVNGISIAGCDLLGSCLYTAGVCAANGGKLAPIGLTLVTIFLYIFRLVYNELVTALPLNGGTYNLFLNTTNKKLSSVIASFSLLCYTATAIMSAFASVLYLSILWPSVDIRGFTVLILVIFASITLCGVKESASVTLFIFTVHSITLLLLIIWGFAYGIQDGFSTFHENTVTALPDILSSKGAVIASANAGAAIYFSFCNALLGITGIETACNYVEELKTPQAFMPVTFWLWLLVGIFNPLLSVVSMMVLPMDEIYSHSGDLLAQMAEVVGGHSFKIFLCIDAIMILCGGVLTAILGVSGLLDRLAKDKAVPEDLAAVSSWGASYVSIICFTIFCICLFLCIFDPTDPNGINRFGGVFAIAFLFVLASFAFAAILLKVYRPNLARLVVAEWWHVAVSVSAILIGLIGNIVLTPDVFVWFLVYLSGLTLLTAYMFLRVDLLSIAIWMFCRLRFDSKQRNTEVNRTYEVLKAYQQQNEYVEFELENVSPVKNVQEGSSSVPSLSPSKPAEDLSMVRLPSRSRLFSHDEHEFTKQHPWRARLVSMLTGALDHIVNEPFGYFVKRPDPISLHLAIEYIAANEASDNIYIIHFVDDRRCYTDLYALSAEEDGAEAVVAVPEVENGSIPEDEEMQRTNDSNKGNDFVYPTDMLGDATTRDESYENIILQRVMGTAGYEVNDTMGSIDAFRASLPLESQQLLNYVSILDSFYAYKKIHTIIIRGAYYCPSAVNAVSEHLKLPINNTIMGVPDTCFKFSFSKIRGCRLVIQDAPSAVRRKVIQHLWDSISDMSDKKQK